MNSFQELSEKCNTQRKLHNEISNFFNQLSYTLNEEFNEHYHTIYNPFEVVWQKEYVSHHQYPNGCFEVIYEQKYDVGNKNDTRTVIMYPDDIITLYIQGNKPELFKTVLEYCHNLERDVIDEKINFLQKCGYIITDREQIE